MDRRIVNNILSSFEEKLMKRNDILDRFKEILQNEFNENIIRNLRHCKDIIYVMFDYYYIISPMEKSGHYLKYSTNEMVYAILNKLNIRWYHGLDSALEYNQVIWQGIVNPVIINNYISGKRSVDGVMYQFHKIKDDLFGFGAIKKKTNNNIVFFYSDIEKTYLDFLYFRRRAPQELKRRIDWKHAKQYMKKYPGYIKRRAFYQ